MSPINRRQFIAALTAAQAAITHWSLAIKARSPSRTSILVNGGSGTLDRCQPAGRCHYHAGRAAFCRRGHARRRHEAGGAGYRG